MSLPSDIYSTRWSLKDGAQTGAQLKETCLSTCSALSTRRRIRGTRSRLARENGGRSFQ